MDDVTNFVAECRAKYTRQQDNSLGADALRSALDIIEAQAKELAELRAIRAAAKAWRAYMDDPTVAGAAAEQRAIILDAILAGRGPTP